MRYLVIGIALAAASRCFAAPVLNGPPPRSLTDPMSLQSPASANAAPVPLVDFFDFKTGSDASFTPDGKSIVFSSNISGRLNLWSVPASGGAPTQISKSDDRQTGSVNTPDGRVIFQSDKAGAEIYDLYAVPLAGGAPVNLTRSDDISETGPKLSRDGKLLAFNHRLKSEPADNVAVMDLASGAVRLLTHEASKDYSWQVVGFTADGRTLIADRADFNQTQGAVYAIDVATGVAKALTPSTGLIVASDIRGAGDKAAVTFEVGGARQAGLLDIASGKVTPLKADVWEQESGDFTPDGGTVVFSSNVDGRETLFGYDVATGAVRALPFPPGLNLPASPSQQGFSPDGSKMLAVHQSGNAPVDLWVADLKAGSAKPLHAFGSAALGPDRLPPSQLVHYKSADGTVISAFMWLPFNLKRDSHAPGVVYPHGGPTGQTVDRFDRTALALASRGYVVIAPNPRGSSGYGRAFQDGNLKDLGGGDLEDEVAAKRFIVASGYVDAGKVGITGGSYGGYMTLMAVGKTPTEWAAAVEQYGIIDWAHMYATEGPPLQAYQRGLLGTPDANPEIYKATSPLTFIHQERAPLLVLQGDNDMRVPRTQAEQVVATLKADGRTVDVHFYANEGHGFVKRENQIDALTRLVAWFDKYLKDTHGS